MSTRSPLSDAIPQKISDLPREFLLRQLGEYFHSTPPPEIVESDYSLWRCTETNLEFCDPPLPGNTAFYEWVSSFPSYYPGRRWEYGEVSRLLQEFGTTGTAFRVLDVGSGKGDFLRELHFLPADAKYALDLNAPAIQACSEQGFHAHCGTLETAAEADFLPRNGFPVVTSFHCLEHVSQPVDFVRGLLRAAAPGGRVFLSTPYSPMSFESDWFDVMNHPPHHMARWNLRAYRRLAEILGVKLRHFAPLNSPLKQAVQAFRLRNYGANTATSLPRQLRDLSLQLPRFLASWRQLSSRAKLDENGGADVVLIELTVP